MPDRGIVFRSNTDDIQLPNLNKINKDVNVRQVNEALDDNMQADNQIHEKVGQIAGEAAASLLDVNLDYR